MKRLALAFLIALTLGANSFATDCKSPDLFVKSVSDDAIKVLDNKALTEDKKQAELTKLFNNVIDIDWMAKFVLGRNWNGLKPDQQKKYSDTYRAFLTSTYVSKFNLYTGKEEIEITGSKPLANPSEFFVSSLIRVPNEPEVSLGYRVKKTGNCYKVNDIVAEGVSLISTQRQDFNAVVNRKGFDQLIEMLEQKTIDNAKIASK